VYRSSLLAERVPESPSSGQRVKLLDRCWICPKKLHRQETKPLNPQKTISEAEQVIGHIFMYFSGLALVGCQVPTKATLSPPFSAGQERRNKMKGSWVEIRIGRSLASYHHG